MEKKNLNYIFKAYNTNKPLNFFYTNKLLKNKLNSKKIYLNLLLKPLSLIVYKQKINKYSNPSKTLALNFKRNRFFPNIRHLNGYNFIFASLGMFMKFFTKAKSFLKTKTMYLILASFLRKILIFSKFKNLILIVSRIPVFLKEILNSINEPVINIYKNPFTDSLYYEKNIINQFKFSYIMFLNNKNFGNHKLKKKGRLKRKITKRIILSNRLVD